MDLPLILSNVVINARKQTVAAVALGSHAAKQENEHTCCLPSLF